MTRTSFALGFLLISGCSSSEQDLIGHWLADAKATQAAFEKFVPEGARSRFQQATDDRAEWRVEFRFLTGGRFERTMRLPILTKSEAGTWRVDGDEVHLQVTTREAQPLPEPKHETMRLVGNELHYGPPGSPTFVLVRSSE